MKYNKIPFKIGIFSEKSAKISFKMMNFDENFTKIASKTAQIALKPPENEVFPFKIRFETDLKRKTHEKSHKSRENCPLRLGHRVLDELHAND